MSNEIKEWRKGNAEPTPKDPRPVYFQDVEILRKEVNRLSAILEASVTTLDGEVEGNLATKVDKVVGKELSDNNFTNALMALTGATNIVASPDLMPQPAFVQIPYGGGADLLTIEAVTLEPGGEDISVVFTDPDDISQALAVAYDAETYAVTVTHATETSANIPLTQITGNGIDAQATAVAHGLTTGDKVKITGSTSYDGVHIVTVLDADTFIFASTAETIDESGTANPIIINTAAGNLVPLINNDVTVGNIIQAYMVGAGIVDFVGTENLSGYEYGRVCKQGEIFSNGEFLFIALTATDGIANETTDFKKVALVDI